MWYVPEMRGALPDQSLCLLRALPSFSPQQTFRDTYSTNNSAHVTKRSEPRLTEANSSQLHDGHFKVTIHTIL